MLPLAGGMVLALALLAALYAMAAAWLGALREHDGWVARGRRGLLAVAVLLGVAMALLLAGLLGDRWELRYIAEHSARGLPLYLKIAALWAGQEGSLLLWAVLQAALAALFAARPPAHGEALVPWATALLAVPVTVFTGLCLLGANPFVPLPTPPLDGAGLNPLLRHPAMVLHPPLLYVGYVGLTVPAVLALAALIVGAPGAFVRAARGWALGAWLFLGIGLLLGARWAYDVLGWGGYWGWDPVENAGLLPWLTATGLLHALGAPRQGIGARAWAVCLAVASFLLVIAGTYITRSGMIASVHAFAHSRVGPPLLVFLGGATLASVGLIVVRAGLLAAPRGALARADGRAVLSREGLYVLTLVLLATLTASILIGTLLPTLTGALGGLPLAVGTEWFDRVTGPQFAGLVLLMGLCPLVGPIEHGTRSIRGMRSGVLSVVLGGMAVPGVAAMAGVGGGLALPAMALIGAAGGATLTPLIGDALAVRHTTGRSQLGAVWGALTRYRRRLGGWLVHAGVLIMAVGIVATRQHTIDATLVLPRGEHAAVQGYALAVEDLAQWEAVDHTATRATVAVYRHGTLQARLTPQLDRYPASGQVIATPAVRSTVREDLYLVLAGWTDGGTAVTLRVITNTLVRLIWIGGLVLLLGGAVALYPERSGRRAA
jgi:cytochrome c-type biogenesis protein CcmF